VPDATQLTMPELPSPAFGIARFTSEDLQGVLDLCTAERWPSLPADPARAGRALTSPGSTTMVARESGQVIGFCQVLSDGEIQAYCALLLVAPHRRQAGVGRALLLTALKTAGGERLDLLAEETALPFYRSLQHRDFPGFRIYPDPAP